MPPPERAGSAHQPAGERRVVAVAVAVAHAHEPRRAEEARVEPPLDLVVGRIEALREALHEAHAGAVDRRGDRARVVARGRDRLLAQDVLAARGRALDQRPVRGRVRADGDGVDRVEQRVQRRDEPRPVARGGFGAALRVVVPDAREVDVRRIAEHLRPEVRVVVREAEDADADRARHRFHPRSAMDSATGTTRSARPDAAER